jgi:predicted nucleic acid-binding protein
VILLDTNVLVALSDERDALHGSATRDLKTLAKRGLGVTSAVMTESLFLLTSGHLRRRVDFLVRRLRIECVEPRLPYWPDVFEWLLRYQDHEPDFVDAELAILCGQDSRHLVWTYDREFRTTWRRLDGTPIPLVGKR